MGVYVSIYHEKSVKWVDRAVTKLLERGYREVQTRNLLPNEFFRYREGEEFCVQVLGMPLLPVECLPNS